MGLRRKYPSSASLKLVPSLASEYFQSGLLTESKRPSSARARTKAFEKFGARAASASSRLHSRDCSLRNSAHNHGAPRISHDRVSPRQKCAEANPTELRRHEDSTHYVRHDHE